MKDISEYDAVGMMTDCGFLRAFWDRLREYRAEGDTRSQRRIFEELDDYFRGSFGIHRFRSYDAFKKCLRRKRDTC